jgi:hypothetical protein
MKTIRKREKGGFPQYYLNAKVGHRHSLCSVLHTPPYSFLLHLFVLALVQASVFSFYSSPSLDLGVLLQITQIPIFQPASAIQCQTAFK